MKRILVFLGLWVLAGPAFAVCPGTASDCPSPTYNQMVVGPATGGAKGTGSINAQSYYQNGTLFTGGSSVTWPASTDLVISNSTNSPAGLAPINGDCVVGAGGAWTAAACPGGGGISGPGTTVNGFVPLWNGTTGAALSAGFGLGTGIQTALGVNVGSAGAPVINGGALGTPSSGNGSNLTNIPLGTAVTGILLGANGGTGVANTGKTLTLGGSLTTTGAATPTLAFGASTFTYTFPGATANLGYQVGSITTGHCLQASGTAGGFADAGAACGSGGSVSITSLTPNIVVAPSPITGTGTVASTVPLNTQSGASYAILTGDNTQLVEMTNASATTMTIPVAGSAGFTSGWGTSVMPTLAATTITPASGTIGGQATLTLQPGQFASIAAGSGTNYDVALGIPPSIPSGTIASGKNIGLDSSNRLVTATVSGGSSAFSALTSSTNTTAAMVVGTGASIAASGSGTIGATAAPISGLTGAGTGVLTALAVNVGTAGAPVVLNGAGGTPSSMTGTNITGIPNAAVAAAPLPTPGTSATLVAPRSYYVCTGTCTVTVPVPAAGYEFCIQNDVAVSTVITMAAIGSSARYGKTDQSAYGTAGTGTFISGGAAGDKICLLGRDSTHYVTASFNGTWTAN